MVHHVEALFLDVLQLHLLSPVKLLDVGKRELVAGITLVGVLETAH